jgi:hypothetical protein
MRARRHQLTILVGPDSVRAEVTKRGATVWVGEAAHGGPADLAEVIAQLAGEPVLRRAGPAEVLIAGAAAQVRHLDALPPVSADSLGRLVAHQQKRFFRRNGSPVLTAAVWHRPKRWWIRPTTAEAIAVDEAWADALARGLGSAGLRLGRLAPAGASRRLRLLPSREASVRRTRAVRALRAWTAMAAVLWMTAAGIYGTRMRAAERRVIAGLGEIEPLAAAVRAARIPYEEGRQTLALIERESAAGADALGTLALVAASLPDSCVITLFTVDSAGAGVLGGLAPDANTILAALERSAAVAAPRLDGLVVREAFGGREWDRFTLRFGGTP